MILRTALLSGLGIAMATVGMFMTAQKQRRFFLGLAWMAVGGALVLAAFKPELLHGDNPASTAVRMRLALGLLSFLVLMITLEAVRRFAMEERYALLWVSTGLILVGVAIYPDAVGWLAALTGMQYVIAITMVVFSFLLLVVFHFSLALSDLKDDQKRLCQHAAALELRVAQLEKTVAAPPPEPK